MKPQRTYTKKSLETDLSHIISCLLFKTSFLDELVVHDLESIKKGSRLKPNELIDLLTSILSDNSVAVLGAFGSEVDDSLSKHYHNVFTSICIDYYKLDKETTVDTFDSVVNKIEFSKLTVPTYEDTEKIRDRIKDSFLNPYTTEELKVKHHLDYTMRDLFNEIESQGNLSFVKKELAKENALSIRELPNR